MQSNSQKLAVVLFNIDPVKYHNIIYRAGLNGYHDYKFDCIPGHPEWGEDIYPKMRLANDLSKFPELNNILEDVMNGVYDDDSDEEDKEQIRQWLLDDNAGDSLFGVF